MGVEDDFFWAIFFKAKPGMERMFETCQKAWGHPDNWPNDVRRQVCEAIPYRAGY